MEGSGVIGREELEEACDQYLAALRCVLWGQPFEVVSAKGRKEAAVWLADQIEGVTDVVGRRMEAFVKKERVCECCGVKEGIVHRSWCRLKS